MQNADTAFAPSLYYGAHEQLRIPGLMENDQIPPYGSIPVNLFRKWTGEVRRRFNARLARVILPLAICWLCSCSQSDYENL